MERTKSGEENSGRDVNICKRCGKKWEPIERWACLHDLCPHCFNLYDNQKMAGRVSALCGEPKTEDVDYWEDSDNWTRDNPYSEHEVYVDNMVDGFRDALAAVCL